MPDAAVANGSATRHSLPYSPALDGLRGLAVAVVFLFHARLPGFEAGFLGVDVFFVLSGYLITTILLSEVDRTGTIDWRRFVLRRIWRLSPALVALCVVFLLSAPILFPEIATPYVDVLLTLTYMSDLTVALLRQPQLLSHSWSLSVEEHFYLFWPLLLLALRRVGIGWLPIILLAFYIGASGWRLLVLASGTDWWTVYFRLDTRLSGLMFGAVLAALCRALPVAVLARQPLWLIALPIAAVMAAQGEWRDPNMLVFGVPLVELATASMIVAVLSGPGVLTRLLSLAPLRWLGMISYSLYLWHYPVLRVLRDYGDWPMAMLVGLPVSLGCAVISFLTVERWGLKMRTRLGL